MSLVSASKLPLCRTQDLTVQHVGEEILIYDERTHQAYCLNAVSAAVWKACDGTRTPLEIAALIGPDGGTLTGETIVRLALSKLHRDGLIEGYLPDELPVVSRRRMLIQGGAGLALALPAIAMIAAPRAAQAYTGCFDCASSIQVQRQREFVVEQQRKTDNTNSFTLQSK